MTEEILKYLQDDSCVIEFLVLVAFSMGQSRLCLSLTFSTLILWSLQLYLPSSDTTTEVSALKTYTSTPHDEE